MELTTALWIEVPMDKTPSTPFPILSPIARRWSSRAFSAQPVDAVDLRALFEAARWAPSAANAQPWRFIAAASEDDPHGHELLAGLLTQSNRVWATKAPLLVLATTAIEPEPGAPNIWAEHDLGVAVGMLLIEATTRGLVVHPMGGFDRERARAACGLPHGVTPVVLLAIGHPGDSATLPEALRAREVAPRARASQDAFVFGATWGAPLHTDADYHTLLDLWFGSLDAQGLADEEHAKTWFQRSDAFDELLRERFGALHTTARKGQLDGWLATPHGRLALILLLDQLSRNLGRGTPAMFANDARALALALEGVEDGEDGEDGWLAAHERAFLYLPLMHSEQRDHQERCVELYADLADSVTGEAHARLLNNLAFARAHRDIIAHFGRFPHRNTVLGRTSTADELAFLQQPGSSF